MFLQHTTDNYRPLNPQQLAAPADMTNLLALSMHPAARFDRLVETVKQNPDIPANVFEQAPSSVEPGPAGRQKSPGRG
ncbi:hypothetical protein [Mycolicibacterium llatzerense]|uniref:hypothetical protein n=1 Tax=Mycolicibacterium llatzerense TaxID=280871 RepID=UPI0008DD627E|nr:hypothetical protein [Mycolicibacterium llatzerense]